MEGRGGEEQCTPIHKHACPPVEHIFDALILDMDCGVEEIMQKVASGEDDEGERLWRVGPELVLPEAGSLEDIQGQGYLHALQGGGRGGGKKVIDLMPGEEDAHGHKPGRQGLNKNECWFQCSGMIVHIICMYDTQCFRENFGTGHLAHPNRRQATVPITCASTPISKQNFWGEAG
eukprot:scaffold126507_cov21-Tisochrysis_lutea.AAC.1